MSQIHGLTIVDSRYTVVIHVPIALLNTALAAEYPDYDSGKNRVGVTWKDAGLGEGSLGSTRLAVGTGPGEITQDEKDDIEAGDVVEIPAILKVHPETVDQADLVALGTQAANDWILEFGRDLRFYGHTQ